MTTNNLREAYIYIRTTNSSEQNDERQQLIIHRYAAANNIRIIRKFVDKGVSTKSLERSSLKELLKAAIEQPVDCVIVSDYTRISRNIIDYRAINDLLTALGISLIDVENGSMPQTPTEVFMQGIMSQAYMFDNVHRTEMVKKSMKRQAEAGYAMQRPPLGYERSLTSGLYTKNNTASALGCYFKQTLKGEMSVADLREAVSRIYHKTISMRRLKTLIANPYYSGYISYGGNLYKGRHDPLFSEEEQNQLLELVSQ